MSSKITDAMVGAARLAFGTEPVNQRGTDRMRAALEAALSHLQPSPAGTDSLWCMHILGPDDVHAAPSKAHAERAAAALNAFDAARTDRSEHAPKMEAVAAPWPHSAESHADYVADFIPQWLLPAWQVDSLQPSPAGQGDARAQFETWAQRRVTSVVRAQDGDYVSSFTHSLWHAWQAALAARQPVDPADPWRGLYDPAKMPKLDGVNLYFAIHPDLPSWPNGEDEERGIGPLITAQGFAVEVVYGEYPDDDEEDPDYCAWLAAWTPIAPAGDGWRLACIQDSEDGPAAFFVRPLALTGGQAARS